MDKLLDINPIEVAFVIITISLLMYLLNRLFFKPVETVMGEREAKIERDEDVLRDMIEQINKKNLQIEDELKKAKKEANQLREELIKEGEKLKDNMIEEAKETTNSLMSEKMIELDRAVNDAEKKLSKEIDKFSDKIREKFL